MTKSDIHPTTVLLVDDNVMLRMHASELLKDAGYSVLEASDTTGAMTICEAHRDIDVLFTDVQLSTGPDGLALAGMVKESHPDALLLITSGGPKIMDESIPTDARFINKPYSDREVLGHIAAMLANQREAVAS